MTYNAYYKMNILYIVATLCHLDNDKDKSLYMFNTDMIFFHFNPQLSLQM